MHIEYNFPPSGPLQRTAPIEAISAAALRIEAGRLAVLIDDEAHELEMLSVHPPGDGPFPLAVLSHGNPRNAADRPALLLRGYLAPAEDFARRGYRAVVFARRGFASSSGRFREGIRCRRPNYARAARHGAQDYAAVIEALRVAPDIDAANVVAVGLSGGGLAATALATRPPDGLRAVVNFAGGLGSRGDSDICRESRLTAAFRELGEEASVPALWLYSTADRFFRPELVRRNVAAYGAGGAAVRLDMVGPLWSRVDGHYLVGRAGRELWRNHITAFLNAIGAPNWRTDPGDAAVPRPSAPESCGAVCRAAWYRYLNANDYKAFAIGDLSACLGPGADDPARAFECAAKSRERYGWSGQQADAVAAAQTALSYCETDIVRCKVISHAGAPPVAR